MIALTDAVALGGWALAVCACALKLLRHERPSRTLAKIMIGVLFLCLLVLVPALGLPLAAYLRGIGGDLSMTLLALCTWRLSHRLFNTAAINQQEFTLLMAVISAFALLLYPTALGWGSWDAYRLGWGSWWFLSALLALCAISVWRGLFVVPALLALALLAWSVGLMESSNLWDYLLDPWLSAYAVAVVFIKCTQFIFKRFANRSFH